MKYEDDGATVEIIEEDGGAATYITIDFEVDGERNVVFGNNCDKEYWRVKTPSFIGMIPVPDVMRTFRKYLPISLYKYVNEVLFGKREGYAYDYESVYSYK